MKRAAAVIFAGIAAIVPAATFAGPVGTADPASPRTVYQAFTDAMASGDIDTAKKYVIADARRMKLLDDRRPAAAAEKQFRAAVEKSFPGALQPIGYGPATTRPAEMSDPVRVTVKGDTAVAGMRDTTEQTRLRRVDGDWKVDLNAMYSPADVDSISNFRGALVEVMNAVGAEIGNGRFKSYDEVQAELETRVKMRLATPDLPVTTRPAF